MALPTASDNPFPSLLVTETAAASISSPAAGKQRLFVDTDHVLKYKNSAGTVSNISSGGSVVADTIWDTKGDLAVASAADTAAKLAVGSNGQILTADSAQTLGMRWGAGSVRLYDYEVTGSDKDGIDTFVDGTTVTDFAGYAALEIWLFARSDEAVVKPTIDLRFNNDSSAVYDRGYVDASNTTVSSGGAHGATSLQFVGAGASATANVFSIARISIPNHTSTAGYKVLEMTGGLCETAQANTQFDVEVCMYRSTSAITRIAFDIDTAGKKFKIGTRLTVYGR